MPKADLSPEAYIPVRNRTAVYTDTDVFGENYVSLNAAPCCFSEAILGEFS